MISDPGFEESGTGDDISPRPNYEMGWRLWPPIEDLYNLTEVGPGNQCACLNKFVEAASGDAALYQYIWVGPTIAGEGSHHVNVEFDYRFDPDTLAHGLCLDNIVVTCPELDMGVDGGTYESSPRPSMKIPQPVFLKREECGLSKIIKLIVCRQAATSGGSIYIL